MTIASRHPCDDVAPAHAAPAPDCTPARKRWVLAASILGSSLAFVDGTVVNVALPAIQRALRASAGQAQWVVESYALLLAALLLVGGSLGDRLGRRRVFVAGVLLFAVASLACALSRTVQQLIAARALQGVGAALLVPGSLALISANFPQDERGRAFGTWAAFSGVTSAVGPLLGGYLVDRFSWAWAFAVNLPLAAVVVAITLVHVPESRRDGDPAHIDVTGALLATAGLGGIVFFFIEAAAQGWGAPLVVGAGAAGVASLVAFFFVERRQASPMLPLSLLRLRDFSAANLLTLLLYAALGGGLFFLPLNLIQVQGMSATAAGASLLPFILVMFVLSRWAGGLVDRRGARGPLIVGPLIAAGGFALLALPGTRASYWSGFEPRLRAGLTAGGVPDDLAAAAWQQRQRLAAIELPASAAAPGARGAVHQAFVAGYRWIMVVSALLALASAGVAALWIGRGRTRVGAPKLPG